VILCGSVAFAASSWLSSPDERPLAEVRFDERAQARGASAGTEGVVKLPSNKTQQSDATETPQAETKQADPSTRVAPYVQTQQPQRPAQQTPTQQPTQQPTSPPTATTPSTETSQPSTPPSSETPPPPSSTSVAPPSNSTPPASNPLPTPSNPVDVSVDLGLLDPVLNTVGDVVGGFDFFAPVN
jgi:hypothetical protein